MFKLLRKKKIGYLIKNYNRQRLFLGFKDINKVLILFHYKDIVQIEAVYNDLINEGKEVWLWTYDNKSKKTTDQLPKSLLNINLITPKEISRLGSVSPKILSKFESSQYDTIIDFTTSYEYVLYYLLACNKSRFCIGIRQDPNKLYDFTLVKEEQMGLTETYEQLKKYLNDIRKSTNNL